MSTQLNESVASVCSSRYFIADLPHLQDSFVDKLLDLMPRLMTSKPAEVVKILQTMLRQSAFLHLPLPEQVRVYLALTGQICPDGQKSLPWWSSLTNGTAHAHSLDKETEKRLCFLIQEWPGFRIIVFSSCLQIHKASATIIEPAGESDNPLRFTSGLVVALDVDATLEHVQDPQNTVKVQVCQVWVLTELLDWPCVEVFNVSTPVVATWGTETGTGEEMSLHGKEPRLESQPLLSVVWSKLL